MDLHRDYYVPVCQSDDGPWTPEGEWAERTFENAIRELYEDKDLPVIAVWKINVSEKTVRDVSEDVARAAWDKQCNEGVDDSVYVPELIQQFVDEWQDDIRDAMRGPWGNSPSAF